MARVKIYGAGSIGNHLGNICRSKDWDVLMCDRDPKALTRTKNEIYPSRYGSWDEKIQLAVSSEAPTKGFDAVIIGTPPDTHMSLAMDSIKKEKPKVILIEKPLATPSLENCQDLYLMAKENDVQLLVGYNHTTTENTKTAEKLLKENSIGDILLANVRWQEYWGGIFAAHPWLNGPRDSYLGFYARGGGACGEHSHCINIFQHISRILEKGKIVEVTASMDFVRKDGVEYDRSAILSVKTDKGLVASIVTDVVTEPSIKTFRLQGENGYLEWFVNYDKSHDAVIFNGKETLIEKSRPDDFRNEVNELENAINGNFSESPIAIERGLETMLVISAAYKSAVEKRTIILDYSKGYSTESLI